MIARRLSAGFSSLLMAVLLLNGCSVVNVNGTISTADNELCVVPPEGKEPGMHALLLKLLRQKRFDVRELPAHTPPSACRQTLVYRWGLEQYYVPALVKRWRSTFISAAKRRPMRASTRRGIPFLRTSSL